MAKLSTRQASDEKLREGLKMFDENRPMDENAFNPVGFVHYDVRERGKTPEGWQIFIVVMLINGEESKFSTGRLFASKDDSKSRVAAYDAARQMNINVRLNRDGRP